MKKKLFAAAPVLMFGLFASATHAQNYQNNGYQQQYPQQQYPQQQQQYPQQQYPQQQQYQPDYGARTWDAPPPDFDDVHRRAFHDGIDAARFDFQNNRRMDYDDARNYRRPPVPSRLRNDYRQSFARGYQVAQQRMQWMQQHNQRDWDHDHDNWRNNYPYSPR